MRRQIEKKNPRENSLRYEINNNERDIINNVGRPLCFASFLTLETATTS